MTKNLSETFANILVSDNFHDASLGLIYYSPEGKLLHANHAVRSILDFNDAQMETLQFSEIAHPEDSFKFDNLSTIIQDDPYQSHTIAFRCFDGQGKLLYLRMLFCTIMSDDNKPKYILSILENRTQYLQHDEEILLNRKLIETIAEHSPATVWMAKADLSEVLFVNNYFCELVGVDKESIIGASGWNIVNMVHPDDRDKINDQIDAIAKTHNPWKVNYRLVKSDGSILHIEDCGCIVLDDNGIPLYLIGSHYDVTEKIVYMQKLEQLNEKLQKAYDKVKRLSEYDSLTNCLNRAAVMEKLSDAMYQFNRYEIPSTLLFTDLNSFKEINDKYGHHAGDQILKSFVTHIQSNIRQTDIFGRIGGDEFLLLFPGATQMSAQQYINKAQQSFTTHLDIGKEKPITVTLNYAVGITELDFSVKSIDDWVDRADRAMYVDKISSQ